MKFTVDKKSYQEVQGLDPSVKLTFSPLKVDGKGILPSCSVSAYFQGLGLFLSGRVRKDMKRSYISWNSRVLIVSDFFRALHWSNVFIFATSHYSMTQNV